MGQSEQCQGVHSVPTGECSKEIAGRTDLSPPSWGHTTPGHSSQVGGLVFSCLFISPSSSPGSQRGLSPTHRTQGLWHPVCDWIHSLPRASVHPCNLPFPLVPSPACRSQPDAFLPVLLYYVCIFLRVLVVQESFYQFPVSFLWEVFHMQVYFWCVHGGRWAPCPLTLPSSSLPLPHIIGLKPDFYKTEYSLLVSWWINLCPFISRKPTLEYRNRKEKYEIAKTKGDLTAV